MNSDKLKQRFLESGLELELLYPGVVQELLISLKINRIDLVNSSHKNLECNHNLNKHLILIYLEKGWAWMLLMHSKALLEGVQLELTLTETRGRFSIKQWHKLV